MAMPELTGWLEKTKKIKGRLVNWKKRYFKRNGSRLYYYRSDRDTISESLGFIDLNLGTATAASNAPQRSRGIGAGKQQQQ